MNLLVTIHYHWYDAACIGDYASVTVVNEDNGKLVCRLHGVDEYGIDRAEAFVEGAKWADASITARWDKAADFEG